MITNRNPAVLAIAGAMLSTAAAAAGLSPSQFRMQLAPQHVDLAAANALVGADGKANMIIVLKDEPATHAYARALRAGGSGAVAQAAANSASRAAVAHNKAAQAALMASLRGSGVAYSELYRVQRVLNGIAVRMNPRDAQRVSHLPNVERVAYLPVYKRPANIASVPFVNAPKVWDAVNSLNLPTNATGTGVKIGDIDTGLDFIHPDFGGTGALADYQDVDPTSVLAKSDSHVIFPTAKVPGGTDFAGDDYTGFNTPQPDPNPMDCGGHGSHTAGTLAGLGVNSDGTPYSGLYDPIAPYAANLRIGPGVAPGADLYALRVFGCGGSTALVTQAIEWATDPNGDADFSDHLDVINMSLGSPTGIDSASYDSDIDAVNNAALAGVVVVSAAGNEGDTFFISGAPGAANVGLSVAASVDASVPGAVLNETAPTAQPFTAEPAAYANPAGDPPPPAPNGEAANVVLALDTTGGTSLGCDKFKNKAALKNNLALIDRGTCNFTLKVQNAQAAGAIGVIIADNTANVVPILMGGTATVQITIPALSISKASGAILKTELASSTVAATLTGADAGDTIASFSSRGPVTTGSGATELKPDLAAPGLDIPSVQTGYTCNGTTTTGCITPDASGFLPGGQALTISGTSMATPHVAGMMALLRQLNPGATVEELKAMAINGAAHGVTLGANATPPRFGASRVGAGRIDAAASATSPIIAFNQDVPGAVSVTFDIEPVAASQATHNITLENRTASEQTVTLSLDTTLDSPGVSLSVPGGPLVVPAGGSTTFAVTMNTDTAQMKRSFDPTMAPAQSSSAFGIALSRHYISEESAVIRVLDGSNVELARLPVYAATRPHSTLATADDLGSSAPLSGTTNLSLAGDDVCTGTRVAGPSCTLGSTDEESLVSAFELQVAGAPDAALPSFANLHYVGVNSAVDGTDHDFFFGIAAYGKWGTPTDVSYNVCIDSDNDGKFDKVLANTDLGTLDALFGVPGASAQDTFVGAIYDNVAGTLGIDFLLNLVDAQTLDTGALTNNTMILGGVGADLGLAAGVTKLHYGVAVCPGFNPLCGSADWTSPTFDSSGNLVTPGVGTANCGIASAAFASFNGPYSYDAATPGVDGQGNLLAEDLSGGTLAIPYDVNNLSANGSTGMLLLHTHNTAATSAQVVILDRIFANGFN